MRSSSLFFAVIATTATFGCESPAPAKSDPATASAAPAATKPLQKAEKPAPAEKAKPASDSAPTGGSDKPPTVAEWNAETKEVTVRGSSKLNCETKMVRSWLRVSCRGKNDTGGEPTGVKVIKGGGHGRDFTLARNKVASLVVKWQKGVDLEATFSWSDKQAKLHVFWPHGAPEPPYKGIFSAN